MYITQAWRIVNNLLKININRYIMDPLYWKLNHWSMAHWELIIWIYGHGRAGNIEHPSLVIPKSNKQTSFALTTKHKKIFFEPTSFITQPLCITQAWRTAAQWGFIIRIYGRGRARKIEQPTMRLVAISCCLTQGVVIAMPTTLNTKRL